MTDELLDSEVTAERLLALVLSGADVEASQAQALRFVSDPDPGIRGIALLCFGHVARLHRRLDLERCLPSLLAGLRDEDPFVHGHAASALSDIEMYLGIREGTVEPAFIPRDVVDADERDTSRERSSSMTSTKPPAPKTF